MATKLIRLDDGTLVEAEVPADEAVEISGGAAEKVNSSLDRIEPLLVNVCRPVTAAWRAVSEDLNVEHIQIELGLSFEGEGNVFVTRAKAGASLTVTTLLTKR